jgi:hypothetical protein
VRYVTVSPAYGRDYKNGKEALAAWNEGRDFLINDMSIYGTYVSKREAPAEWEVSIRYNNYRDIVKVKP